LQFDALAKINSEILRLAQLKRYEAAWKVQYKLLNCQNSIKNLQVCIKWIPLIREALNYFHRYHQFSQGLAIGALFCSWNFVLFSSLFRYFKKLTNFKNITKFPCFQSTFVFSSSLHAQPSVFIDSFLYCHFNLGPMPFGGQLFLFFDANLLVFHRLEYAWR
jgi:hypothetical protein